MKVFLTTTAWSIFAYLWMYIVLVVFTPDEVTIWEAIITLLSFPVLVVNSYMAEMNFFLKPSKEDLEEVLNLSEMCKITDFLNFKKKKKSIY